MRNDTRPPSTLLAISYQLLAKDRTILKVGQWKKLITACNHPQHTHPIDGQLCSSITMRNDSKGNSAASSLHYAWRRFIYSLRSLMKLLQTSFHSLAARCFGHRQVIEAVWLSCYATASQQSHSIFTAPLTMRNGSPCGMSVGFCLLTHPRPSTLLANCSKAPINFIIL